VIGWVDARVSDRFFYVPELLLRPREPGCGETLVSLVSAEPGCHRLFASREPGPSIGPGNQSRASRMKGAWLRCIRATNHALHCSHSMAAVLLSGNFFPSPHARTDMASQPSAARHGRSCVTRLIRPCWASTTVGGVTGRTTWPASFSPTGRGTSSTAGRGGVSPRD